MNLVYNYMNNNRTMMHEHLSDYATHWREGRVTTELSVFDVSEVFSDGKMSGFTK